MNPNLNDDLEEGEIADDITPEPVLDKKSKDLPRRYTLNDKKGTPKHKKSCKHASQHHNRNNSKSDFFSNTKFSKKHHKACSKRKSGWYNNVKGDGSFVVDKKSLVVGGLSGRRSYTYQYSSGVKSAFKNFTSPPRKVSKFNNCHSSEYSDNFPQLLSEYKNTRDELKFKNISNLKKQDKSPSKITGDKHTSVAKQESSENLPPRENARLNSDDEDEEELRRIALATCVKRQAADVVTETINSCETENSATNLNTLGSDNYEVVDMDIDEESENVEKVDNLFVIDTTPTYYGGLNQQVANNFGYNLCNDLSSNGILQSNGFISSLNVEDPFQNFSNNAIGQNLNNDLYITNFSPILVNESNPPSSQLEDDFEEELLRAELLANITSIRKKTEQCTVAENISEPKVSIDSQIGIDVENKVNLSNLSFKGLRTISVKNDGKRESSFNERIVSIENKTSEVDLCFKERTVSIVNESTKKDNFFIDRIGNVPSLCDTHDVPKVINTPNINGMDIKVKLNNIKPNTNVAASKHILPQERIIISLNNESSSDDSDQEDVTQENPVKDSAVASLEALITNARNESDGKKESVANSNNSSDVFSWLSKAQQEEYNSLMKILAKKQQTVTTQPSQNNVKKSEATAGLILLKKKMLIAKKNLEKEEEIMNNTMKDLVKKKRAYMLSKLRTQHLKEQLLAAERVRKSNLQLWTKCSSELQTLKKSVSKRQAIINSLESKINLMSPDFDTKVLPIPSETPDTHNLPL